MASIPSLPVVDSPIFKLTFDSSDEPQIALYEGHEPCSSLQVLYISEEIRRKIRTQYPPLPGELLTEPQFRFLKKIVLGNQESADDSCLLYAYTAQKMAKEVFGVDLAFAMVIKRREAPPLASFLLHPEMKLEPKVVGKTPAAVRWSKHCFLLGVEDTPLGQKRCCIVDLALTQLVRCHSLRQWRESMWDPATQPTTLYLPRSLLSLYHQLKAVGSKPEIMDYVISRDTLRTIYMAVDWLAGTKRKWQYSPSAKKYLVEDPDFFKDSIGRALCDQELLLDVRLCETEHVPYVLEF